MRIPNITGCIRSAVVAAFVCCLGISSAEAWSFGSWGSYGSCGSCGSYGSYGYTNDPGYARYVSSGSYGSYGAYGSYGSYGSYGRERSAWSGSRDPYTTYSAPIDFAPAPPMPPEADGSPKLQATIRLSVPEDAKVFVNDQPTTSTGRERDFISRDLEGDQGYVYRLRVEFEETGKQVIENKTVRIKAGDVIDLKFGNAEQLAVGQVANSEPTLKGVTNDRV